MSLDLIRRAKSGDEAAFDRLVGEFGRLVLSLARRILRNPEDAEDAAQEVFLRLFRAIDTIDEERPLEPWLIRVTMNVARNRLTRGPGRREQPIPPGSERLAGDAESPDAALRGAEVRDALEGALRTLPEREGTVFLLRDLHGLPAATVAAVVGTSPVTVRRQSAEARKKVLGWLSRNRPELVPPARTTERRGEIFRQVNERTSPKTGSNG